MIHKGKHLLVYNKYFDIDRLNPRVCEITGNSQTVEVTHIEASGMGGRDSAHTIDNLMCLTAFLHRELGDKEQYKDWLKEAHQMYMETRVPLYFNDIRHPLMKHVLNLIQQR